ncbi:MAG: FGGY family carbohydrate kinase [Eubacteriales bacterium]|nr:FGGY family carbohydrate kinase [Eubacteriales bacterium]
MERLYIGIDMGTSSVKVQLMNEDERLIANCSEIVQPDSPQPDWKEIDPERWFQAAIGGLKRVLQSVDRRNVRALCCTGQMHSLTLLDAAGKTLRPAILWNDCRTAAVCAGLREKLAEMPDMAELVALISTGSPAANLLWVRENEPEVFKKLDGFLMGSDYLTYRFTGERVTDWCEASVSALFDAARNEWSPVMRDMVGLSAEQYPALRGSAQPAGRIRPEIAEALGLPPDVLVATGTGDNPAATVSTGSLKKRFPTVSIGTAGVLVIPQEHYEPKAGFKNVLLSLDGQHVDSLLQGVVQSAGNSLQWWARDILKLEDYSSCDRTIDRKRAFRQSLIFYPHLVGDKAVHYAPELRGAFLGIDTNTGREQLSLAVLEGVCFGFRELLELVYQPVAQLETLHVTGGGSRSDVWMQVLADVLNVMVKQLDSRVGAAYGAALLAAMAQGKKLGEATGEGSDALRSFAPQLEYVRRYQQKYEQYQKVYEAVRSVYQT